MRERERGREYIGMYSGLAISSSREPIPLFNGFPLKLVFFHYVLKKYYTNSYNHQSTIILRKINILSRSWLVQKNYVELSTKSLLESCFLIFQLHQFTYSFRVWQSLLIPLISWAMNFPKIEKNSYFICRLPHSTTKINLGRIASFFSQGFVTTSHNNRNLASYLKIFTKPSRTISFKTTSPSITTNLS